MFYSFLSPEGSPRRVFKVGASFVISEGGTWLPGVYAAFDVAKAAFDLPIDKLQEIQDKVNRDEERDIRWGDISEWRPDQLQK